VEGTFLAGPEGKESGLEFRGILVSYLKKVLVMKKIDFRTFVVVK